jgi:hypothetical protein
VAVTLDTDTGEARLYHALADGKVRLAATAQNFSPPDATERDLEIGNLGGIRPFKGVVDNVRIFDGVLGEEEIGALFRADIPPRRTLKDYAQSAVPMSSLFRHADICFSTRWKNPKSFDVMKAFHANRVLWVYAADKNFIQQCREAGAETYQGAFNSTPRKVDESAYARNIEGQRVVAPWMVAFDRKNPVYWGCNNQPAFMEASISSAKKYVDAGADMLQFDDWQMTVSAGAWGGSCFCEKCMEGFRRYLQERLPIAKLKELGIEDIGQFNYRQYLGERFQIKDDKTYKEKKRALPTNEYFEDFQRRSVRAFFAELRKRINAEAGRVVPLSINSTLVRPGQEYNFIVDITDFFLGETWALTLPNILIGCKAAEGVGKWQVFSPIPRDVGETRLALAATYALGQLFLVPWDIYMGSDASGIKPRYFGKAEEYGDLYEFVHKNAPLFNEYETPAKVGVITNTDQYETVRTREVCQRLLEAQVPFTFVTPGHSYYDHSLDPKRLSQFDTLVRLNELEDFAPQDRATTESVADKVPVIHYSKLTDECLREMSLFEVWGPKNIYILPRTARNPEDRTLVCHVINPNQTQDLANLKWVSFLAKREALLGTKLMSARWYAPGQAERGANGDKAIDLEYEVLPEGVRVIIPKLPMWGVAVLRFE